MGVITSMPDTIKLNLNEVMKGTRDTFVIDSQHYENSYQWTAKACQALLNNKSYKKIIFKLTLTGDKVSKFTEALAKVFYHVESIYIYGSGMSFFEDKSWKSHWKHCKIESLSIKDKLTRLSFSNFCAGLTHNTQLKDLTLKALEFSDIGELNSALTSNKSIRSLTILCESRASQDSSDESMYSTNPSTYNLFQGVSHLLSDNLSVSTYTLGGYLDLCPYLVLGLIRNKSVKKLVLESIDIDRENLNIWSEMLRLNGSIKEFEVKRGLNTTAAMILFSSLKKNKEIEVLKLSECTFGEVGFMVLQDLFRENCGIRKVEIKDLIRLRNSVQDEGRNWKNLVYVVSGLVDNVVVEEFSVTVHVQNCFLDGDRTVAKALRELASVNRSLVHLRIDGFRLTGMEICSFVEGLENNTSLQTIALCGNQIEWQDLFQILHLSQNLTSLKLLDLQDNKIFTFSDLEKLRGHQAAQQSLQLMKDCLSLIKQIKFEIRITPWFLEPMSYPPEIQQIVKSLKANKDSN